MYADLLDSIGLIAKTDPDVASAMEKELERQRRNIELIASENIVSPAVMAAMGSILTNKYAEGYPGRRYYGGCEYVDVVEEIARKRACELFGAEHANVQPHSGAQANIAVYFALLKPGDTIQFKRGRPFNPRLPRQPLRQVLQYRPLRRRPRDRPDRL